MPITYKVTKCRNPKNPDMDFFKGTAVKTGDYNFDDLADDIAESPTVTTAARLALHAAPPATTNTAGQRVVLDELGSFIIGVTGKCYNADQMALEDFSPSSMIKGWHLIFRPEARLKRELANGFALKRISSDAME